MKTLQAAVEIGGWCCGPDGIRIGEREHAAFRVLTLVTSIA